MQERERKKLRMPEVVGLREEDAQALLRNMGFAPARIRFVDAYEDVGTIVQQAPLKGQLADSHGPLMLTVCRRSYMRLLPQIYQVDASTGNPFLREYLWIFQHLVESVTKKIDGMYKYFHPLECPPDFLPWLASWVALTIDTDWPEIKKRTLIRRAAHLYRNRGTRRAMIEILDIFVGKRPKIIENKWPYTGFRMGVTSAIGEDTIVLPPINLDHCFIVQLPIPPEDVTEEMVVKIHNIINHEKPSHTTYFLQFKSEVAKAKPQVFMQIGAVSTIGLTELRYDAEPVIDEPTGDKTESKKKE